MADFGLMGGICTWTADGLEMESICTAKSWTEKGLIKDLTSPNNPNRIWVMAGFVLHYRLIVHSISIQMDWQAR